LSSRAAVLEAWPRGGALTVRARAEGWVIANIAGNRREKGRWRRIWGVIEPTAADCCADGEPWDAAVGCDGFGPAPPPEVLETAMARSGRCIGSCGMGKGATATATLE
jgi:hypothetical protein